MKSYEFWLATKHLGGRKRQTVLTGIGVAGGVMVLIVMMAMLGGFEDELIDKTVSLSAHILVSAEREHPPAPEPVWEERNALPLLLTQKTWKREKNITSYPALIKKIANLPGVSHLSPIVLGSGILTKGDQTKGVTVKGIVPETEEQVVEIYENLKEGSFDYLFPHGVLIGWRLADRLGVSLGDRLMITSSEGVALNFRIVGIFDSGLYAQDLSLAYVSLRSAQRLFRLQHTVTHIGVKVDDIYAAEKLSQKIEQIGELDAQSWMEQNKEILAAIATERQMTNYIVFFTLLIAAIGIANVLIMAVLEKSRDIGILKSMGATRRSIMTIFVLEGLLMGAIGTVGGIILGTVVSLFLDRYRIYFAPEIYGLSYLPVKVNLGIYLTAIAMALGVSLFASLFPARRAAGLDPVEVIRHG